MGPCYVQGAVLMDFNKLYPLKAKYLLVISFTNRWFLLWIMKLERAELIENKQKCKTWASFPQQVMHNFISWLLTYCHPHHACVCVLSCVQLFVIPWTVACQIPFMEFSRQEYRSGLPFSPPGESSWPSDRTRVSCIGRWFFTTAPPGKPTLIIVPVSKHLFSALTGIILGHLIT